MTKKEEQGNPIIMTGTLEKRIPKFSNSISFEKTDTGNVLMTFMSRELVKDDKQNNINTGIVIERIVVEQKHAKQMVEILQTLID